jgi:predicted membrane protein
MTVGLLLWGVLFSSVGLGFVIYAKQQRAVVPLVCGIILMIYPFFVNNVVVLVAVGVAVSAVPYFFRL